MNAYNAMFHTLNNDLWHVVGPIHRGKPVVVAFGTRHVKLSWTEYDKLQAGYLRPCDFSPIEETDSDENEVREHQRLRAEQYNQHHR